MGKLKTYLEDSEIGKFGKVFPQLTVPTLGSNTEGYLKNLAECAIEQIKFLNSYATIPVATLYENVGQRNKANNLALLASVRRVGNTGEGLDLIAMPGDDMGAYAAYGCGIVPENLWQAQENLLEEQNAYLTDIKETFAEKRQHLNIGFNMTSFVNSDFFKVISQTIVAKVVDWITDIIPGWQDDLILDSIAQFGPKAIGWGMVWLNKQYFAGAVLCERMQEENLQLLKISPQTYDHYRMRSDIISQHDMTMQSLLQQIALVETQVMKDVAGSQTGETSSEPAIMCPHTGDFIFAHSRGKMTKA